MSKFTGNQRVSALKRLGSTSNTNNSRASTAETSIRDARQLLTKKKSNSFDARQLINRPSINQPVGDVAVRNRVLPTRTTLNKTLNESNKMILVTGLKDMKIQGGRLVSNPSTNTTNEQQKKKIFAVGSSTFVTVRNPSNSTGPTDKISLIKTIKNPAAVSESTVQGSSKANEKFVISIANDTYQQKTTSSMKNSSPASSLTSFNRNLNDASIQTSRTTTKPVPARPPIRTNSQQKNAGTSTIQSKKRALTDDEDDDNEQLDVSHDEFYEPPVKRASVAVRKTSNDEERQSNLNPTKRISIASSLSSRSALNKTKPVLSNTGTILITNLQSSVTQEDVTELFEHCGQIVEITTLSRGCVQIIYAKYESAEQAVAEYHNRLLDGQLMYVSLQQSTKPKTSNSDGKTNLSATGQASKDSGTSNQQSKPNNPMTTASTTNSNKIVIDPIFMRQALFHPSNNTTNPVQFQVKL